MSPFQGYAHRLADTQGDALGCLRVPLRGVILRYDPR